MRHEEVQDADKKIHVRAVYMSGTQASYSRYESTAMLNPSGLLLALRETRRWGVPAPRAGAASDEPPTDGLGVMAGAPDVE
jgi:hypothetical protein